MSGVYVVVGATGVVGRGIVRVLLDSGCRVVAIGRSADALQRLKESFSFVAELLSCEQASFDSRDAVSKLFGRITQQGYEIEAVVMATSGDLKVAPLEAIRYEELMHGFATSLAPHFALLSVITSGAFTVRHVIFVGGGTADFAMYGYCGIGAVQAAQRALITGFLHESRKRITNLYAHQLIVRAMVADAIPAMSSRGLSSTQIGELVKRILFSPSEFSNTIVNVSAEASGMSVS